MNYSAPAVERILELLPQVTTLEVVREFLEGKGLPHSAGSWAQMTDDRLRPYAESRQLSMDELFDLLRDCEEFGQQHIFLYKCSATEASRLMNEKRIHRILEENSLEAVWNRPRILEQPSSPTIADVRYDEVDGKRSLVVKAIETRIHLKPPEVEDGQDYLVKRWKKVYERAVLLGELHQSGFLEIRVFRHRNSTKYEDDLNKVWGLVLDFLPPNRFRPVPLGRIKSKIATRDTSVVRKQLKQRMVTLRNRHGNSQSIASGSDQINLYDDKGAVASTKAFLNHGNAFCDGSAVVFPCLDGTAVPSRDLRVLISGMSNEFAVTLNCGRKDHRYLVREIRRLNR